MDLKRLQNVVESMPYGLARRMIRILPVEVFVKLRVASDYLATVSKCRPIKDSSMLTANSEELIAMWLEHYVRNSLNLTISTVEHADKVVPMINGTYVNIYLRGEFTWRHALKLIHNKVKNVTLQNELQIEEEDFETFIKAVCDIIVRQDIVVCFTPPANLIPPLQIAVSELPSQKKSVTFSKFYGLDWVVGSGYPMAFF